MFLIRSNSIRLMEFKRDNKKEVLEKILIKKLILREIK